MPRLSCKAKKGPKPKAKGYPFEMDITCTGCRPGSSLFRGKAVARGQRAVVNQIYFQFMPGESGSAYNNFRLASSSVCERLCKI